MTEPEAQPSAPARAGSPRDDAGDLALVARALAGDGAAVRTLVDRLAPAVEARVGLVLLRRGKASRGRDLRAVIEDLTQEVFEALFADGGRTLRAWQPERGLSLKGFVALVAEREAGAVLRTGKRSPFSEDPTSSDTLHRIGDAGQGSEGQDRTARVLESRDLLETLLDRLQERLSVQGFHLFQLLHVEERSIDEICQLTALSPDAVYAWRSRIGRLARTLRDELEAERQAKS